MTVLRSIRENLGFTADDVANAVGWSKVELAQHEAAVDLNIDSDAAYALTELYGIDVETALETGTVPHYPLTTLLRGDGSTLSVSSRFELCEAASVAREIRKLEGWLGQASGWSRVEKFRHNPDYGHPAEGVPDKLAEQVRKHFHLGERPILSIIDDLFAPLGVLVLSANLPDRVDAFCFATPETGAVVVANCRGEHTQSAFGRRITWAHELCHILFDRPKMQRMARFCAVAVSREKRRPRGDDEDAVERRARAFSACLLAPKHAVREEWRASQSQPENVRLGRVMAMFGMSERAASLRLHDVARRPHGPELATGNAAARRWDGVDATPETHSVLVEAGVSALRAGLLWETLWRAFNADLVGESYVRGALKLNLVTWMDVRVQLGFDPNPTFSTSYAVHGFGD